MKLFCGILCKCLHRKVESYLSILHADHPVTEIAEPRQPVLRDHNGLTFSFPSEQCLLQLLNSVNVQIGCRLIQHHHLRAQSRNGGAGNLLLFSAREFKDAAP